MTMTFLTGGARSGKSTRALLLAQRHGGPVTFVATAETRDDEMSDRIRRHRAERPVDWATIEAPHDLGPTIASLGEGDVGILDCLSLWVSNLLERGDTADQVEQAAEAAARACASSSASWFVVSNEVGLGLVPMHPVGRDYRDRLGRVNSIFSRHASTSLLLVAGRAIRLGDHNDDLSTDVQKGLS